MDSILVENISVINFYDLAWAMELTPDELFEELFPTRRYEDYGYGSYIIVRYIRYNDRSKFWDEVVFTLDELGTEPISNDIMFIF